MPHPVAVLAGDDAEAVVLDLVQPRLAGGRRVSFGREAGGDEAGRKRTQHVRKHRGAAAKCESGAGIDRPSIDNLPPAWAYCSALRRASP